MWLGINLFGIGDIKTQLKLDYEHLHPLIGMCNTLPYSPSQAGVSMSFHLCDYYNNTFCHAASIVQSIAGKAVAVMLI